MMPRMPTRNGLPSGDAGSNAGNGDRSSSLSALMDGMGGPAEADEAEGADAFALPLSSRSGLCSGSKLESESEESILFPSGLFARSKLETELREPFLLIRSGVSKLAGGAATFASDPDSFFRSGLRSGSKV